jgi:hypothetical protein
MGEGADLKLAINFPFSKILNVELSFNKPIAFNKEVHESEIGDVVIVLLELSPKSSDQELNTKPLLASALHI